VDDYPERWSEIESCLGLDHQLTRDEGWRSDDCHPSLLFFCLSFTSPCLLYIPIKNIT
jgi:hypothetical protein